MHSSSLPRLLAACTAAALMLAIAPTPAHAQGPSVGIRPADEREYFHVQLAPGQVSERPAIVSNFSADPVDLLIYPADATITAKGDFALAEHDTPARQVGAWIHLPVSTLHLAGHASTAVTFPITVPPDTAPGDYAGGILIQSTTPGKASTVQNGFAVQLNIVQRVGARIYLHVAGKVQPGLRVGHLTWHKDNHGITFSMPITNTGNIQLHPTEQLRLQGFNLPTQAIAMSRVENLLPGSTVTVTGQLADPPAYGYGHATATVTDDAGQRGTAVTSISLVPVLLTLGVLGALAVLLLAAWRFTRFLRRARAALRLAQRAGPMASA
jgi:hypothetical protein